MKIRSCTALFVRVPSNALVLLGVLRLGIWIRCYGTLCLLRMDPWTQGFCTLTKKVLFLVALATAKRVSELQALSRVIPSSEDDLIWSYLPFFVAKTESPSNPLPRSFWLKALSDFAHGLEEGSLLCPVRALHIYLRKTKGLARRSSALFVSPQVPSRAISKNALSFFLRYVIIGAGAADVVSESSVRAHSIRGVATSVVFLRNWSVPMVLEAATWRSNSVFASFYLKDILYLFEDLRSLHGSWVSDASSIGSLLFFIFVGVGFYS